jgi:hypothetical protein
MAYTKYSLTPANNTAAPPDGAPEGMLPSAVNDTMRDMMAQIRDCGDGIRDGTYTMTAPKITGGTITGATFTGNTFSNPIVTGVATFSAGTVSAPAITTTGDTNTGIFFPAADTIAFGEGGAEAMRINSSGNLLVGGTTGTAAGKLTVTTANAGYVAVEPTSSVTSQIATGLRLHGNINETDRYVGIFCFNGAANNVNDMTFWTTSSGVSGERMRITSGGDVLIGTTSALSNAAKVQISGGSGSTITSETTGTGATDHVNFRNGNGKVGTITTNGSATSYNTSSDYRLKKNIEPMQNALNVVAQLKPVIYTWKSDNSTSQGFIAHELQAIVPDCVTGEKDAVDAEGKPVYQGIDTSFLVATLTAAIQELKAELDATKAEVQALKGVS